jgi:hypothetical protein
MQQVALRKLRMLNRAYILEDLRVRRPTGWRSWLAIGQVSGVSELTISGEFAFVGGMAMRLMWK